MLNCDPAAKEGASLVVLPELITTGYRFNNRAEVAEFAETAMERIVSSLERTSEDQAVLSTRVWAAHDFFYWRALRKVMPYDEAIEHYHEI